MKETVLLLVVFMISGGTFVGGTRVPPVFSRRYTTKGILYIPSEDFKVVEHFEAWLDAINNKSRIDYQNGVFKTFQLPGEGQYGTAFKVVTQRSLTLLQSKTSCEKLHGTNSTPINLQNLLPDLKGFQFLEEKVINGVPTEGWQRIEASGDVFGKYTMWVQYMNKSREAVPILYEVKRHNKVLNDTIDKYSLNFTNYSADLRNDTVFYLPTEPTICREVNATNSIIVDMNPMLEFMQGLNSHVLEAFRKFKEEFNKTYPSDKEELRRFNIFKKNYRFILTMNRANWSFQLSFNQYTDLSKEEINEIFLRRKKATFGHVFKNKLNVKPN